MTADRIYQATETVVPELCHDGWISTDLSAKAHHSRCFIDDSMFIRPLPPSLGIISCDDKVPSAVQMFFGTSLLATNRCNTIRNQSVLTE